MEGNPYGRESVLRAVSDLHGGETKLENVYCTAPFKLLPPLPLRDGGAAVTQLSVSAGLLAGDRQQIDLRMGAGGLFSPMKNCTDAAWIQGGAEL